MDTLFPTDNALDIPQLRVELQAEGLDGPLVPWGTRRRGAPMRGTWHFYVDDYRFARLWERPELLVDTDATAVVEPNWTVVDQTPMAVAIALTYRKRWLARWWQDRGLRVWVDLNVSLEHRELNLLGVPADWRAFATRGYESRPEAILGDLEPVADRRPIVLVYGGGPKVREIVERIGALHVPDDQSEVRDRTRRVLAGQLRGCM